MDAQGRQLQVEELLRRIYLRYKSKIPETSHWDNEKSRENALYACLFQKVASNKASVGSTIFDGLGKVGLLDPEKMARSRITSENGDKLASIIVEIMVQNGYDKESASYSTELLFRLAKAIEDSYGGKLQVMLRKYGNMMLNELESELGKGLAIERKQLRAAITIWLQNTLEMPVLLEDEILETFCQLHNITQDELVAAADRLDLNLAVLDELLAAYLAGYGPNGLGLKTFQ